MKSQSLTNWNFFTEKHLNQYNPCPPIQLLQQCCYLLGLKTLALPIEAEIHKRQLSLLYSILQSDNNTVKGILSRQLAVYNDDPDSFCGRISNILQTYNLPTIEELLGNLPIKSKWKYIAKTAVNTYWTAVMRTDIGDRSTLSLCNLNELQVGKVHHVWNSLDSSVLDVKKGIVKARMLTGVYNLQQQRAKFSKTPIDPKCNLCRQEEENLVHTLTRCPVFQEETGSLCQPDETNHRQ